MAENLEQNTGAAEITEPEEKTTYSKEEVEELLQKETDRRVTSALKKQELKNQTKLREAERLASMSAEDKYKYELEQREAAIAAKERELVLAENKAACAKDLAERGLSTAFVDFCVNEDADVMYANIKAIDKAFKASVKAEVERRLGSKEPKQNLPMNESITIEKFKKMTMAEQTNFIKQQPELYKELIK